jgi:stage II sporulation protein M
MYDRGHLGPLIVALAVFFISVIMGVVAARASPEIGVDLMNFFSDSVASGMVQKPPLELAGILFINNLGACLLLFVGGASFGGLTFFILAINGVVIGAVLETARSMKGLSFIIAAILPHGVFEIPSFLVAGTLGFILARSMLAELQSGGDAAATALTLSRTFLLVVVPLVACAALIEAFITPEVIRLVVSS